MPGPNSRSVKGGNPRGDSAAIQITNEPMTGSLQLRFVLALAIIGCVIHSVTEPLRFLGA
jgi:hypothetical protein